MSSKSTTTLKPIPGASALQSILSLRKDRNTATKANIQKYGPIHRSNILGVKIVTVSDPEVIEYIHKTGQKFVIQAWPKSVETLNGEHSLSTVTGKKHQHLRRMMERSFTPGKIELMIPLIAKVTRDTLKKWSEQGVSSLRGSTSEYTFDIATMVLLGEDADFTNEEREKARQTFVTYVASLFTIPIDIDLPFYKTPFREGINAKNKLMALFTKFVEKSFENGMNEVISGDETFIPLLQQLAQASDENGERMSIECVANNCLTIMFAGHDTSSAALVIMMTYLSKHPDVVAKLVEEQKQMEAKYGDTYSLSIIKEMKYLDAFVWEMLRVVPVVGGSFRKALVNFELPGTGLEVKKGDVLSLSISAAHYFENSDKLDASLKEKFETVADVNKALESLKNGTTREDVGPWLPFGGGKRRCLGKPMAEVEIRIFIAELIRHYEFGVVTATPEEYPEWSFFPIPTPKHPLSFNIKAK